MSAELADQLIGTGKFVRTPGGVVRIADIAAAQVYTGSVLTERSSVKWWQARVLVFGTWVNIGPERSTLDKAHDDLDPVLVAMIGVDS